MSSGTRRRSTRHEMTIGDKMEIIRLIDIRASQNDIAKIYNCSQSQISRMASRRSEIISDYDNCEDPQQKKCRYNTSSLYVKMGQPVPSPAVVDQSTSPRTPAENNHDSEKSSTADTTNNSWLEYWKRHSSRRSFKIEDMDISRYAGALRGLSTSSRGRPKVNKESRISNQFLDVLKCYDLCDIYCADELALHYDAMPSFDSSSDSEDEDQTQKQNGVNDPEQKQISVLLTCNVTASDKRDPLIIENSQHSSSSSTAATLAAGCHRARAPHAWMTADVYREFLVALNYDMWRQHRYILLLVDNAPPHVHEAGKGLEHVRVVFLRSYCTPFFHGIFYNVRAHYRKQVLLRLFEHNKTDLQSSNKQKNRELRKNLKTVNLTLEEAVTMLKKAWQGVSPQDIVQCFSKAGICAPHIHGLNTSSSDMDLPDLPSGFISDEQFENFVNADIDVQCAGDALLVSTECRILSDLRAQGFGDIGLEPSDDFTTLNTLGSSLKELEERNHNSQHSVGFSHSTEFITVPLPTSASSVQFSGSGASSVKQSAPNTSEASRCRITSVHEAVDIIRSFLEQSGLHLHNLHALEAQISSFQTK